MGDGEAKASERLRAHDVACGRRDGLERALIPLGGLWAFAPGGDLLFAGRYLLDIRDARLGRHKSDTEKSGGPAAGLGVRRRHVNWLPT